MVVVTWLNKMVKLFVFFILVTLTLTVNGLVPQMFRGDPFPEPKEGTPVPRNIVLNTITQQLDNFDPISEETWEQRYNTFIPLWITFFISFMCENRVTKTKLLILLVKIREEFVKCF